MDNYDRKAQASCLGTSELLLVLGGLDVEERSVGELLLLLLGSSV